VIDAPTPTERLGLIPAPARPVIVPRLDPVDDEPIGNGRPTKLPRRRLGKHSRVMLLLVLAVAVFAAVQRHQMGIGAARPLLLEPVVVASPLRLEGAWVMAAAPARIAKAVAKRIGLPTLGEPVAVSLTAYCLRGLTRRDHYVREGIVASDPKLFPLGHYLEIYVGKQYWGRFLIDDTGGAIKGNKLDIWTPTCREARLFGRVKGTAVLVPKPRGAAKDTVTTGRLNGRALAASPPA
jgi:3D (Asp-Asp-Asp) domain-containing protein